MYAGIVTSICIFLVIFILYVYVMQYRKIDCKMRRYHDLQPEMRNGDIILFKAYNNLNVLAHGSYFSHIGMVYHVDGVPHLFEAANPEGMHIMPYHNKCGIFMSPLYERISKYKGDCFIRHLNKPLNDIHTHQLIRFIYHAITNMYYDKSVIKSGFSSLFGKPCGKKTNCGQIMYLVLIAMGLLPMKYYRKNILHHLMFVANITDLSDGYEYEKPIKIVDHPFAY